KGIISELKDIENDYLVLTINPLPYFLSPEIIYDSTPSLAYLGEFYRTIQTINYGEQKAIVYLNCTPRGKCFRNSFITNPSIIDGVLVAVLSLARIKSKQQQEQKDFLFLP